MATKTTTEENLQLSILRENIQDVLKNPEDHFLIRWLRARDLDVVKAEEMLRNYIEWRSSNIEFKLMINWTSHNAVKFNIHYKLTGFDPVGRPVFWAPVGRWEVRKFLESEYKDECFRLQYQMLEEVLDVVETQRLKCGADQFILIADSAELNFRKVAHYETVQGVLRFFREYESYYPELLYACYIVNTPKVFTYMFNLVRPLVSARTLSKVKMFDFNEVKWKAVLLDELPSEVVPEEYGGTGEPVLCGLPFNIAQAAHES